MAAVCGFAVGDGQILAPARAFGAHLQGVAEAAQNAVGDGDIFVGSRAGRFQANRIVFGVDDAIGDQEIVAAVDIEAVVVGVDMIGDPHSANMHAIARQVVLHPHGRVAEIDVLDEHVTAADQPDQIRAT